MPVRNSRVALTQDTIRSRARALQPVEVNGWGTKVSDDKLGIKKSMDQSTNQTRILGNVHQGGLSADY